jgi:transcriptional regulator with XRE-family HTH domain
MIGFDKGSEMNIQVQLGSKIRELRTKKGLSQEKLADACGLHRSHMGEIERGRANVTLSTLQAIAQKLQTTPAALLLDEIAPVVNKQSA